jgi:DNA-binding MarR family transcriptional regulator
MADLNLKVLLEAAMHPLQLRILEYGAADPDRRFSPSDLAEEWGERLGNVSYHVRVLHQQKLLKEAGTKPVRGALQHYYKIGAKALS